MYYIILLFLLIGCIWEINRAQINKRLFLIVYGIMTLMAIFRFGQLGDYFDYYYLYRNPIFLRDPLFILYASLFNFWGASYQIFLTVTELICFSLMLPFFYKTCKCSFVSLLIFYCYTYMVCPMSALRQAVCLALLLFCYTLLVEGKRKLFYAVVVVGSFIHLSFFSVSLIGLLYEKKIYNKPIVLFVIVAATILMFLGVDMTAGIRGSMEDRSVNGIVENPFDNMLQMFLRLLLIYPLLLFRPEYKSDGYYAKAICIIGFILYCVLASNILVAGRIEYFFRTFLCLFVSYISFHNISTLRKVILSFVVLVHVVLFFKNINAAISQGNYNTNVTMFNFPYISIFNKAEIDEYTNIDKYNYNE